MKEAVCGVCGRVGWAGRFGTFQRNRENPEAEKDGTRAQLNPYAEATANKTQSNLKKKKRDGRVGRKIERFGCKKREEKDFLCVRKTTSGSKSFGVGGHAATYPNETTHSLI
jgi:hypothetical protein